MASHSASPFEHGEEDDDYLLHGSESYVTNHRHLNELHRLSAFQQLTTKVPPTYDGRSSCIAVMETCFVGLPDSSSRFRGCKKPGMIPIFQLRTRTMQRSELTLQDFLRKNKEKLLPKWRWNEPVLDYKISMRGPYRSQPTLLPSSLSLCQTSRRISDRY